MKTLSFSALQKMAKEFDEDQAEVPEGMEEIKTAMDFYLYVVDNYAEVEKEVRKNTEANT